MKNMIFKRFRRLGRVPSRLSRFTVGTRPKSVYSWDASQVGLQLGRVPSLFTVGTLRKLVYSWTLPKLVYSWDASQVGLLGHRVPSDLDNASTHIGWDASQPCVHGTHPKPILQVCLQLGQHVPSHLGASQMISVGTRPNPVYSWDSASQAISVGTRPKLSYIPIPPEI